MKSNRPAGCVPRCRMGGREDHFQTVIWWFLVGLNHQITMWNLTDLIRFGDFWCEILLIWDEDEDDEDAWQLKIVFEQGNHRTKWWIFQHAMLDYRMALVDGIAMVYCHCHHVKGFCPVIFFGYIRTNPHGGCKRTLGTCEIWKRWDVTALRHVTISRCLKGKNWHCFVAGFFWVRS